MCLEAFPRRRRGDVVAAHPQAVSGAIQWLWSLSRLRDAAISRHSERTAARPLRKNRSSRRLALIWPNTGSMLSLRLA